MGKKLNSAYKCVEERLEKEQKTTDLNTLQPDQAMFFWGLTRGLELALRILDDHRGK